MSGSSPPQASEEQRATVVIAVLHLVDEWERVLAHGTGIPRPALEYLRSRSAELQRASRGVALGGIAHHLEAASTATTTPTDVARMRAALSNVREIGLHAREELGPVGRQRVDQEYHPASRVAARSSSDAPLAPPPMITVFPSGDAANPDAARRARASDAESAAFADETLMSSKDSVLEQAPAPVSVFPVRGAPPRPVAAAPADAPPNMRVRTMFGLRAFGRSAERAAPAEPKPAEKMAERGSWPLGLKRGASSPPSRPPPPLLSNLLPSLSEADLPRRRGRTPDLDREPQRRPAQDRRSAERPRKAGARGGPRRSFPSLLPWMAAFGALGVVVIVGFTLWLVRRSSEDAAPASSSAAASASTGTPAPAATGTRAGSDMPKSRLLTDDEQFHSLVAQVHGRGKESPELRALMDEEASVQVGLLKSGKCEGATCTELEKARGLLMDTPSRPLVHRRKQDRTSVPAWMADLRTPADLPIEDDPLVKRYFQQYAENRVGRETLQSMLFRCGAYRDLIRATLTRYDVPQSVMALVLVESGCEPLARSPVGALGLFQFMPDAARGYGLRLIPNVLDERLSTTKSTEAGIRYLSDLYAKLGSWDLVFAAYNLGPFGLVARLHKAGEEAGFWDLVDADMLPDETAQYVPRIEALSLILANLQHLHFAGLQMRAPDDTADLEVPSGTRLGLIARAAATSLDELRHLNRDILADRTPNLPGQRFVVQVPSSSVEQARDALEDLKTSSKDEDTCVPSSFDWGHQRFTADMAASCKKKLAEIGPAPSAGSPTAP